MVIARAKKAKEEPLEKQLWKTADKLCKNIAGSKLVCVDAEDPYLVH
jgi:hypothetical protein